MRVWITDVTDGYGVHVWLVGCQVDSEQRPHKVSFYVDKDAAEEVIKTLTERFQERQVRCVCQCILQVVFCKVRDSETDAWHVPGIFDIDTSCQKASTRPGTFASG